MTSQVRGGGVGVMIGGPGGLPPKNGPLSSSIGSMATITTVADKEANDPEECGRVGGWVASFDKLLEDELGVHALLVSVRFNYRRGIPFNMSTLGTTVQVS